MLSLKDIPDVEFVNVDIEKLLAENIKQFENAWTEQFGETKVLAPGDPIRVWIYAQTLREFQLYEKINHTGKMNLLKYAKELFLDAMGARYGKHRNGAQKAITTMEIILSAAQSIAIPIAVGTRFTPGNNVFFETIEYIEIPIGQTLVQIAAYATIPGESGNNYLPGQINTLVEPLPYVQSVTNIDKTQGGTEIESDESFAERLFLAPEGYSVAGPTGAYEYFTKEFSSAVSDVRVRQSSPGIVDIRVLLNNSELPSQAFIDGLYEYLNASNRRPLTDNIVIQAPEVVNYDINVAYWINSSDSVKAATIQNEINSAVDEYIIWQESRIAKDINPDELTRRMITAGAKRVQITEPVYNDLSDIQVSKLLNKTVSFQGIESD